MKKRIVLCIVVLMIAIVAAAALVGCSREFNPNAKITVVSREDGSGTRAGFDDIVGLKGDSQLTPAATILSSTGAVMTKVNTSRTSIGYISLGSLNDTVKAITLDGVVANVDSVKSGEYKLQRNFNIITKSNVERSAASADFISFILSAKGQKIAIDGGYVSEGNSGVYATEKNSISGDINISGSSSVSPLMSELKDAYKQEQSGVKITLVTSDSGSGVSDVNNAKDDAATRTIGMVSRELKESETGLVCDKIAIDGIVVIVNNKNTLSSLTMEQLKNIYAGNIKTFAEVIA